MSSSSYLSIRITDARYRDSEPKVVFNGIQLAGASVAVKGGPADFRVFVRDPNFAERIAELRPSEITQSIRNLVLPFRFCEIDADQALELARSPSGDNLIASFSFNTANWKKMWSFNEYRSAFKTAVASYGELRTVAPNAFRREGAVGIQMRLDARLSLRAQISKYAKLMEAIHTDVEKTLAVTLRSDAVVALFDFPKEVQVPCEQYLLYFVQFLRELGVEATAEIQHHISGVLFSVTPVDKDEGLDNIRKALELYLHLPAATVIDTGEGIVGDYRAQQLAATIHHFQGQLAVARALIQLKDATIEQQQLTIAKQQHLLSGGVISESLKEISGPSDDKEEVVPGVLSIKPYEGKGFEVNLPELYRRLRGVFRKPK